MHDHIDALFSRWSMKLNEENFSTISLMKSYIDLNNTPVIPHMIEEIPNFKAFVKLYMLKVVDHINEHTKTQHIHSI
jgi:hypothetical protein